MQSIILPIAAALVVCSLLPLSCPAAGLALDTAIGGANNVYLVTSNETGDTFVKLAADAEHRYRLTDHADLYLNGSIDHQLYVTETDASETHAFFFAELYHQQSPWGIGISDRLTYADYRTLDEEGGLLPAGHYEVTDHTPRVYGTWELADNQVFELGAVFRSIRYRDADFDFDELSCGLSHRWDLSPMVFTELTYRFAALKFRDLRARSEDGTTEATNPLQQQNTSVLDITVTHRPSALSRFTLFARLVQSEDDFEDAASYRENGAGIRASLPIGAGFTAAGSIRLARRDFDELKTATGETQRDDFVSADIALERALGRQLTAYGRGDFSSRASNSPTDDYRDDTFSVGIKAQW